MAVLVDGLKSTAFKTEFSTLDDDCIFLIFDWLPLDDLCTMSETCERLYKLSVNQFQRKHAEKLMSEMNLRVRCEGEITLLPCEKYIKCFAKCIRNLKITLQRNNEADILLVVTFMRTKCNSNLKRIRFNCQYLPDSFGANIKDFLKSVEIVKFSNCNGQNNYYDSILKHCPKLKHLTTYGCLHDTNMNGLLIRQHHTLEQFSCGLDNDFSAEKLKIFLQQQPNIKSITWWYDERGTINGINCIKYIVSEAVNLQYLYLSFIDCSSFATICNELRHLCDRDKFKRLEMQFVGDSGTQILIDHVNELALLKKFTKLHFFGSGFRDALPVLNLLLQLNAIHVNSICGDLSLTNDVLPNVEELYLSEMYAYDYQYLEQFIRNVVGLKKIFIPNSFSSAENYIIDILMLNVEREKLLGASTLVIYTDNPKNPTNFSFNLVKIKQTKFERAYSIDYANPFERYCAVTL